MSLFDMCYESDKLSIYVPNVAFKWKFWLSVGEFANNYKLYNTKISYFALKYFRLAKLAGKFNSRIK